MHTVSHPAPLRLYIAIDHFGSVTALRCIGEIDLHTSPRLQRTVDSAILSARYVNPENIAALGKALRRAGLPEG